MFSPILKKNLQFFFLFLHKFFPPSFFSLVQYTLGNWGHDSLGVVDLALQGSLSRLYFLSRLAEYVNTKFL